MIESDSPGWEEPGVILFSGYTHWRSVLKAISWRTLGTLDTFAISWSLTGKVGLAGSIAVLEFATSWPRSLVKRRWWNARPTSAPPPSGAIKQRGLSAIVNLGAAPQLCGVTSVLAKSL